MDNLWFPISFLFNHSSDKYIPEEHSIAAVFSAPQQLRRDGGRPLASQPRSFSQRNPLVIIETTFLIPGHIHIYIYTWKKTVWTIFFCPLWVLPVADFLCSIAYFCFLIVKGQWRVVKILWQHRVRTSSDSLQKRNFSPKWGKLGVVIGYPNLATNAAIFHISHQIWMYP